jgi:two-component system sensor histidine kinase RpfC
LLQQVLVNLAANAIKFTERGSVAINVSAKWLNEGNARLRFEVVDTGIGVPADMTDKIFESFTQANQSTARRHGGTGLGLAISRQIIALMQGEIGVRRRPENGSIFWFVADLKSAREPAVNGAFAAASARALVVCGDHEEAERFTQQLRAFGLSAKSIGHGARAIIHLRNRSKSERPEIVLFDERTAGFTIAEFRTALIQDEQAEDSTLIAISVPGTDEDKEKSAANNAVPSDCLMRLTTPVTIDSLYTAIHAALACGGADLRFDMAHTQPWIAEGRRKLRVLVGEDNRVNRKVIGKMLSRAGHEPTLAETGEALLDALESANFDAILMDVNMPDMTGYEATKFFRLAHPELRHIPVIALTADATTEAQQQSAEAGMDAHLTKPVDADRLLQTIDVLVARMAGTKEPPAAAASMPESPPAVPPSAPNAARGMEDIRSISTHPRFQIVSEPPVDSAMLENLFALADDQQFFDELIGDFVTDAASLIGEMRAAVTAPDLAMLRDRAHALRSGAANVGAIRLHRLLLGVRDLTPHDVEERGIETLQEIETEFARVLTFFADYRPSSPSAVRAP